MFETKRLVFEGWTLDDFEGFAAIARNPEVMRYIAEGEPWPDERIGWFLGIQCTLLETLGYCNWKLKERTSQEIIGFCGLAPLRTINQVEIGWWLKPAYWRRGLAREAASHVIDRAFQLHGLDQLAARAYRANTPSLKLMKNLGMNFDRVLNSGPMGEILLYNLSRERWLLRRHN